MNESKPSLLGAIFRWFGNLFTRKALAVERSADEQFTGSTAGIADAADLEARQVKADYDQLLSAVSQVEAQMELKRGEMERLNKSEADLIIKREGAMNKFAEAEAIHAAAPNQANKDLMEQHKAAFERFDNEITRIDERQADIEAQMKQTEENMGAHMRNLTALKDRLQKLPEEKAQLIADYVSDNTLVQLNERMQGISLSSQSGPMEAVRRQARELKAKARISSKMAGTDVNVQDAQYAEAGRSVTSGDKLKAMLAERALKNQAATGVKPVAETPGVAASSGTPPAGGRPRL